VKELVPANEVEVRQMVEGRAFQGDGVHKHPIKL